nr:salicylate carboxymethyltransferase-like [Ipomoea batatas]GME13587.1 salicylate carboxymethyltransferase-like [Ipomoea batatas]GME16234.1 salicylate carboxymethyltransferase-like [Ipomoea batatas]
MASKSHKSSTTATAAATTMDVEKIFHMNGGVGQTSYYNNSSLQKKGSDKVKHVTLETIEQVYVSTNPRSLGIADLGCSSGPNTLSNIKEIVETVGKTSRHLLLPEPEFRVYLNDLPTNDFNAIFQALPDFYCDLKKERNHAGAGAGPSIYVAAYPGTFYGRIFPDNSLHFIYSSYSLHWLSKVPPGLYDAQGEPINKGSIYITERSPPEVSKAYVDQFNVDFSLFLRLRSEELIVGGKMVLIFLGRETPLHIDRGNSFFWELLTQSFSTLISQGDVEEKKLDSYDVHFYAPSKEDVEEAVKREGSFVLERLEMFEIEKEVGDINGGMKMSYGRRVAMAVRAIQESMMTHHFGGAIVERLFEEYGRLVDEEMGKQEIQPITFGVVLRKN